MSRRKTREETVPALRPGDAGKPLARRAKAVRKHKRLPGGISQTQQSFRDDFARRHGLNYGTSRGGETVIIEVEDLD